MMRAVVHVRSDGNGVIVAQRLVASAAARIPVVAASSQETADAIRQIADKDDRQAERIQLMTQYAAQSSEEAAKAMAKLQDDMRLQNSALDRIEKRQQGLQAKLELLHPAHVVADEPEGKGLPS